MVTLTLTMKLTVTVMSLNRCEYCIEHNKYYLFFFKEFKELIKIKLISISLKHFLLRISASDFDKTAATWWTCHGNESFCMWDSRYAFQWQWRSNPSWSIRSNPGSDSNYFHTLTRYRYLNKSTLDNPYSSIAFYYFYWFI